MRALAAATHGHPDPAEAEEHQGPARRLRHRRGRLENSTAIGGRAVTGAASIRLREEANDIRTLRDALAEQHEVIVLAGAANAARAEQRGYTKVCLVDPEPGGPRLVCQARSVGPDRVTRA